MKVTVFGATGTIGTQIVNQALEAQHQVTAFTRDASKLEITHANLRVVEGDVLQDQDQIASSVKGQDAVIIALGAGARGRIRSEGTRNIIAAMRQEGVERLICQSTLGAGSSAAQLNLKWWLLFRGPLRWAMADHERQEELVRQSQLNWTIVRPAAFTDGPITGDYKFGQQLIKKGLSLTVSRADVAHCLLRILGDSKYRSQSVSLSY